METLRIAFISSHHPAEVSQGLATVVSSLARRLVRRGHEVWVFYPYARGGEPPPPQEAWNGIQAVPVGWRYWRILPFGKDLEFSWRASRRLPSPLDAVISNNENGGRFVMRRCHRIEGHRGAAAVALDVFHGLAIRFLTMGRVRRPPTWNNRMGYHLDRYAVRWLEGGGARQADVCIACSQAIRHELLGEYGIPPDRVVVIPNGVGEIQPRTELERREAREALGLPPDEFVISFVGRDAPRKGLDVAEEAIHRVREAGIPGRLLNVGNLEGRAPFTRNLGSVEPSWKRRILSASDVFLFPTRYEGDPVVVKEAAALGLAVITTSEAHVEILRPGEDYWLVPENTPEAHAAALRELYRSPELRERFGRHALRAVARWTFDTQTDSYERLIRTCLDRRLAGIPGSLASEGWRPAPEA